MVVDDRIVGYRLRLPDQKRHAVLAFQALGYKVVAGGDSYNDVSMLLAADAGFLFRAPSGSRPAFRSCPLGLRQRIADLAAAITAALLSAAGCQAARHSGVTIGVCPVPLRRGVEQSGSSSGS